MVRISTILAIVILVAAGVTVSTQPADDVTRADVRLMRSLNTAENIIRQQSGKYMQLADLIDHKTMGGVRPEITTSGTVVFFQGRQLRLMVSPDGLHYQAMVVPVEGCGTAVFTDERGMIYTGKVIGC
jgi:hypothetical protein